MDAFAIKRRIGLERMSNVIDNGNVFAEQLRPDPVIQKRPLVQNRQPAEIPEHKTHQIKDRRGLKDYGVFSGGSSCGLRESRAFCAAISASRTDLHFSRPASSPSAILKNCPPAW